MHRLLIRRTLLALLTVSVPLPAPAQDAALLLGQYDGTTLIVVHGDTVRARRGVGLVVPRATGWWRVGVDAPTVHYPEFHDRLYPKWRADSIREDSIYQAARPEPTRPDTGTSPEAEEMNMHGEPLGHEACFARVFWTAPLGVWPTLPDSLCAPGLEHEGEVTLSFVSPTLVTASVGITTDYSYNFARGVVVAPLDSLARHPVSEMGAGSELLQDDRDPRWRKERLRCTLEYNRGRSEDPDDSTSGDYQGTIIQREPGRWRYERYYANTSYVGRGSESYCAVRIPVPASITGWDRLTVPLATLRKRVPKLVDAFTSPGSATGLGVAVVIDSTGARVFRVEKGTLGAELGFVPNDPSWIADVGTTVMSQWATGASAGRWERELAGVLTKAVSVGSTPAPIHR